MGTASSSPTPAAPLRPLDLIDAFKIATHWRFQLRGWLTLTPHDTYDGGDPVAFVNADKSMECHLEWITISWGSLRDPEDSASCMRAARGSVVAWLALSSCAGYGIRENPRFWRWVFSTLWSRESSDVRLELPDGVRLFENPSRPFPCIRIEPWVGKESASFSTFFHSGLVDLELRRVLKPLEPYLVGQEWWRREIPVEIILNTMKRWPKDPFLPVSQSTLWYTPKFRLTAVRTGCSEHIRDKTVASQELLAFTSGSISVPVHLSSCHMGDTSCALLSAEQTKYLRIARLRPGDETQASDEAFAVVCSVIPHTHIVQALELAWSNKKMLLSKIAVAWIGYALFHPHTATKSSVKSLLVDALHWCPDTVDVLKLMAKGNNLLYIMGVTKTVSNGYHETRLAPDTPVYATGSRTSQVVHTSSGDQVVSLCLTSQKSLKIESWVAIVVPGIGLGWVETNQITKVLTRTPGRPSLRRMELWGHKYAPDLKKSNIHQILSVLGASLTHLKIHSPQSTPGIQVILRSCPVLVALRVNHNGECWSDPASIQSLPVKPRLRTLELFGYTACRPLAAPQLGDLTCLRVTGSGSKPADLNIHRKALSETLRRFPQLTQVYCSFEHFFTIHAIDSTSKCVSCLKSTPSDNRASTQLTDLHEMLDIARLTVRADQRVAFLSTFQSIPGKDKLPQLSPDVVRLIFEFAVTEIPRKLLVRFKTDDPWTDQTLRLRSLRQEGARH